MGYTVERLLKSPASGMFASLRDIGDNVYAGEVVGTVSGVEVKTVIKNDLRNFKKIQHNLCDK